MCLKQNCDVPRSRVTHTVAVIAICSSLHHQRTFTRPYVVCRPQTRFFHCQHVHTINLHINTTITVLTINWPTALRMWHQRPNNTQQYGKSHITFIHSFKLVADVGHWSHSISSCPMPVWHVHMNQSIMSSEHCVAGLPWCHLQPFLAWLSALVVRNPDDVSELSRLPLFNQVYYFAMSFYSFPNKIIQKRLYRKIICHKFNK